MIIVSDVTAFDNRRRWNDRKRQTRLWNNRKWWNGLQWSQVMKLLQQAQVMKWIAMIVGDAMIAMSTSDEMIANDRNNRKQWYDLWTIDGWIVRSASNGLFAACSTIDELLSARSIVGMWSKVWYGSGMGGINPRCAIDRQLLCD